MKILIAVATWMEVKLLADEINLLEGKNHDLKSYRFLENEVDILITGIGVISATFRLTQILLQYNYNLVINIGLAGSFNREIDIGDVVNVVTDEFADLGIEKNDEFLTLFESGFIGYHEFPFEEGLLKASFVNNSTKLRKVPGITVNRSHGKSSGIEAIKKKFECDIETMEGAAIFYVCRNLKVPCCQIRAISNYVEPRDFSNWNIPLALENLKNTLLNFLTDLTTVNN